jgi:hypothetical protein
MADALEQLISKVYKNWKAGRLKKFTGHPDDEAMASLLEGRLSGKEGAGVKSHVILCDACGYLLALRAQIADTGKREVPEELITALKGNIARMLQPTALEIALQLKEKALALLHTTGDVLRGNGLAVSPLLRSRQARDFKDEITIFKDFSRFLVEIKIEHKRGEDFTVIVTAKDKKSSQVIKDVRATLIKDDVELASFVSGAGRIVFEHVTLGSYTIEVSDIDGESARILLQMRA